MLGWRSPAASNDKPCERGELVQVQDVDALVWRWTHQVWFEQSTTGSQTALAFAAALFVFYGRGSFLRSTCDFLPTFHGFQRAAIFIHALTIVRVFLHLSAQPSKLFLYVFQK